jgi:UTP:GlnB (protein PII) uridylyltransferase
MRLMRFFALPEKAHEGLWQQLDTVYFLRQSAEEIAWHARALHERIEIDQPVVRARLNPLGEGLEVMVYTHDQADLFVRMVGFFSRAGYSIVDARIHTTRHGYALDTFMLLDVSGRDSDRAMISYIEHELGERLAAPGTSGRTRQRAHLAAGQTFPDSAAGQHPAAGQPRSRRDRQAVRADRRCRRSTRPAVRRRQRTRRTMAPTCTRPRSPPSVSGSKTPS